MASTPPPQPSPTTPSSGSGIVIVVITLVAFGVLAIAVVGAMLLFLLPPMVPARQAVLRTQSINNVSMISRALLTYATTRGRFPPQYSVDEQGHRLHSWRTLILPELGRADLYEAFDLHKPWDDPANLPLTETPLETLLSPRYGDAGNLTSYIVIAGEGHVFDGAQQMKISEIAARDGMSNTILLVEIANSDIPWAEPRDLTLDDLQFEGDGASASAPNVVRKMAVIGFADGHTVALQDNVTKQTLRDMLTFDGGEVIQDW